jgi:hypothetical protein
MAQVTNRALDTAYWRAQGLLSLTELYQMTRQSWRTAGCGPACMSGGVRGRGLAAPSYSIYLIWLPDMDRKICLHGGAAEANQGVPGADGTS